MMKKYLLEHGVPEEHIILEDKSLNTMENLKYSRDIIYSKEGEHHVAWYYWPSAVIREFVAVFTTKKFLIWTIIGYILFVLIPAFGYVKML